MFSEKDVNKSKPDAVIQHYVNEIEGMPRIIQERKEFFDFFANEVYPRFNQKLSTLAELYSPDRGRPAENPVRMLAVVLLQYCERLPDRQAAEACQFDLRWKLALHMTLENPTFHPTLLTKFRNRLLEHSLERLAFDICLDLLVEKGWIKRGKTQRLDSTHIHGLLSNMSRLDCARTALKKALIAIEGTELAKADKDGRLLKGPAPRSGGRKEFTSDYFKVDIKGRKHVTLQNYFIGSACNIKRLVRRMVWEEREIAKIS